MTVKKFLSGKTLTEVSILNNTIIGLNTNSGSTFLDVSTSTIPAYTMVNKSSSFTISGDTLIVGDLTLDISTTKIFIPQILGNIPKQITLWQLRVELMKRNMITDIEFVIDSLPEQEKILANEAWNRANIILRNSPTVILIQNALFLSPSEVDDIFINASKISA